MARPPARPPASFSALFAPSDSAADVLVQSANVLVCILALVAFAGDVRHAGLFLFGHLALALGLSALSTAARNEQRRSRVRGFLHDWAPTVIFITFFFELAVLVPRVNPFEDRRYDHALHALDIWLLGDPEAAYARVTTRWLSDALAVCYVAYYPLIAIVPAALYARGRIQEFRSASSIIVASFVLTYIGYVLVPAVGPHLLTETPRAAALDGFGFARHVHATILALPFEPPDAFPSGHALMGMLAPALAWRFYRPLFGWVLPIGIGIVLATLYLRYHYVLDVVAAALVAPIAWKLGLALNQAISAAAPARSDSTPADPA